MHIHGNSMGSNAVNIYSAAQAERAAAMRQAAETRRRLRMRAAGMEGGSSPEENLLIGRWLDEDPGEASRGGGYNPSAPGRDPDFG